MNTLKLERINHENGTNGRLYFNDTFICHTIELPWKQNQKAISCIPEGKYLLMVAENLRFGVHIYLSGVKDRNFILIHPANDALKELKGCIAPVTTITGAGKGLGSKKAFNLLMETLIDLLETPEPLYLFITTKFLSYEKSIKSDSTESSHR